MARDAGKGTLTMNSYNGGSRPSIRRRLPNRRLAENLNFEVAGLRYTATIGRYSDGRIGELFLSNHKTNSGADVAARDAAIAFSFAVQHGADPDAIRRALCRDSHGRPSGPLAAALDLVVEREP
jgi:ribonucleoside-diphosphate reductase alpha chain